MVTVREIAKAIEQIAPKDLQESYDNAGLQVGNPDMGVTAALLCLDVTEEIVEEAQRKQCNLIISHHPLLFHGLKEIVGRTAEQRIVAKAIRNDIAIYAAHTNLDAASDGVSNEMADSLGLTNRKILEPNPTNPQTGLGIVGDITPTPALKFLRHLKDLYDVKMLKYSSRSSKLVVRKVALCGGAGASMIQSAIKAGADAYVTGDIKYHDFTSYGLDILIADIGHYESELCTKKIFSRILREQFPDLTTYYSQSETNPIGTM
jgi:dinuclear metal center YbgI/SA1388 family protein